MGMRCLYVPERLNKRVMAKLILSLILLILGLFSFAKFVKADDANLNLTPAESTSLTIQEIRNKFSQGENPGEVVIRGVVSVLPDVLSSQYFYIQDETGGIQVYSYYKKFPSLSVGDQISVSGMLSSSSNELRVKTEDYSDFTIEQAGNPPTAVETSIESISEQYEGVYIQTFGSVTETSGDEFKIGNSLGQSVKVLIKSSGIDKPKMTQGDMVKVAGILSQYGEYYRILPTRQSDIQITSFNAGRQLDQEEGDIATDHSIGGIRGEENGTLVSIEGKVTVLPGKLSDQYFYIQDALSGIQVYSYYKKFPRLAEGDIVKAVGELSETAGERRVKIRSEDDILIISNSQPLQPKEIKINEISENLEGTYVKVEGHVTKTSGQTFFVRGDNGQEIKVIIKSKTGIKKPKIRKGDTVVIAGIVSQYKDEYRILPFKTEDVKILTSGYLPKAGGSGIMAIVMGSTFYLIWIFFQKKKKRPCLLVRR